MWSRIDGVRTLGLGTPGAMRAELNALVLAGKKRATAGLLDADYRADSEDPEHVGERLFLVGDAGERVAEIEVTQVDIVPLRHVTWEFADAEGEGFRSIEHWRLVHTRFWADLGVEVDDDTEIVCTRFRLVS